jgi:hypothetical protein
LEENFKKQQPFDSPSFVFISLIDLGFTSFSRKKSLISDSPLSLGIYFA